jgi:NAD(P)-dependent dehydrogenase (short-subunit alcohol dehydrogenase family)
MLLKEKTALVFAATGAIGRQVALSFGREGARVYVSGRDAVAAKSLADEIRRAEGWAESAQVDATDEAAVEAHVEAAEKKAPVDVVINCIGIRVAQGAYGTPVVALPYDRFLLPLQVHAGSQFLTARAAARRMLPRGRGVILMLSASLGIESRPFMSGISAACAAIESMTRSFAADLSPAGVRVLGLRPGPLAETRTIKETFAANAKTAGMPVEQFEQIVTQSSAGRRTATVEDVGRVAALLASDYSVGMTSDNINVSNGLGSR